MDKHDVLSSITAVAKTDSVGYNMDNAEVKIVAAAFEDRDRLVAENAALRSDLLAAREDAKSLADGGAQLASANAFLRSEHKSLHKRIRGLAVDLGAVQTEDAVEDVRRGFTMLRKKLAAELQRMDIISEQRDQYREKLAAAEAAMQWRPEVARLASAMEARLRANDHKGGWLCQRLRDEVSELYEAIGTLKPELVWHEAADVANFAMMIADVVERQCTEQRPPAPGGER